MKKFFFNFWLALCFSPYAEVFWFWIRNNLLFFLFRSFSWLNIVAAATASAIEKIVSTNTIVVRIGVMIIHIIYILLLLLIMIVYMLLNYYVLIRMLLLVLSMLIHSQNTLFLFEFNQSLNFWIPWNILRNLLFYLSQDLSCFTWVFTPFECLCSLSESI